MNLTVQCYNTLQLKKWEWKRKMVEGNNVGLSRTKFSHLIIDSYFSFLYRGYDGCESLETRK